MRFICRLSVAAAMLIAAAPAMAEYKGSVKPNWGLADFTKHDEAYYLSLDQIKIGWTEVQVAEEFGNKYKSSESIGPDGKAHKTWRFASYRARMLSDPVDSIVTVDFVDGLVVSAKQVPAPGSDVQPAELAPVSTVAASTPAERLKALQELLDQNLITPEEFESKRKALIDGI
jgi:hypothetical protein